MSRFNLHRWLVTVAILLVGPAVPAGATTMSPPFIKLPFRCVIESGRPIAVSEGSFWHQVLSGDTETRAGNANISTFTQQRSGFIKGFKFTYSSYVNVYRYEIQCDGGSADAAQVALMTGEVSDAPPDTPEDLQHARLFFRDDRLITNVDALSSGLSTGPPILMQRFEHWNPELGHFDIPVHGGLPLLPPSPSPFPEWLTVLYTTAPISQIAMVTIAAFVLLGGVISYKPFPNPRTHSPSFFITIIGAALGSGLVFLTPQLADPNRDRSIIYDRLLAANAAAAAINEDRRRIAALMPTHQPISDQDFKTAFALAADRSIPSVDAPVPAVLWIIVCLMPVAGLTLAFLPRAIFGYLYMFTSYPAASSIGPKLKRGEAIYPNESMVKAMTPKLAEILDPPLRHQSRNFTARARDYMRRMQADRDLARAAAERDIARAELIAARQRLRAARQKLPWWRKWFT